jgi:uncharacterized pyridoxamine 5'-phosphate oxidase family protein
MLLLG